MSTIEVSEFFALELYLLPELIVFFFRLLYCALEYFDFFLIPFGFNFWALELILALNEVFLTLRYMQGDVVLNLSFVAINHDPELFSGVLLHIFAGLLGDVTG